jgi:hypothetical protein
MRLMGYMQTLRLGGFPLSPVCTPILTDRLAGAGMTWAGAWTRALCKGLPYDIIRR